MDPEEFDPMAVAMALTTAFIGEHPNPDHRAVGAMVGELSPEEQQLVLFAAARLAAAIHSLASRSEERALRTWPGVVMALREFWRQP